MSLDEREDPDEEREINVEGLPFVVGNDVIDAYGGSFHIGVNENGMPGVSAG